MRGRDSQLLRISECLAFVLLTACSASKHSPHTHLIPEKVGTTRESSSFGKSVKTAPLESGRVILLKSGALTAEKTLYQSIVKASDWERYKTNPENFARGIEEALRQSGRHVVKAWTNYGLFIFEGDLVDGQFDSSLSELAVPVDLSIEFLHSSVVDMKTKTLAPPEEADLSADWNYFAGTGFQRFLEKTKTELGISPTGKSIKIGIVDSGISLAHPAFKDPQTGQNRIKKIYDTTLEGSAAFLESNKASVEEVDAASKKYRVRGLTLNSVTPFFFSSKDDASQELTVEITASEELEGLLKTQADQLHLGWIEEGKFQSLEGFNDLNGNNRVDDRFLVLQFGSDPKTSRTFIDFQGNGNFSKQPSLRDFNESGDTRKLGFEKIGVSLAESQTSLNFLGGTYVLSIVGIDPSVHGTHVASIAAGASFVEGVPLTDSPLRGLASKADIYVARSLKSDGHEWGAYEGILKLAEEGVDWINLSFAGLSTSADGEPNGVLTELLVRLSREKNIRFIIAAGNEGPGTQSLSSMAENDEIISVAGLLHPRLMKNFSEYASGSGPIDSWTPLSYSSRGPGKNYSFHPIISAPGMLLAAAPMSVISHNQSAFMSLQGTSMAAPFITGVMALLDEAQRALPGGSVDKSRLINVLKESAEVLRNPGTSWHDSGNGLVRIDSAYDLLKSALKMKNDPIQRSVFTVQDSDFSPAKPQIKTTMYVRLSDNEKVCKSIWMNRSPRRGLSPEAEVEAKESIALSLETLKVHLEAYGLDPAFISLQSIEGLNPKFWKVLGNGVDEFDAGDGAFVPRPENKLEICFDGKLAGGRLNGLKGYLLKFYRINPESGSNDPLPAAVLPITVEFDSSLDSPEKKNEVHFEVPFLNGVQQNFNIPESTLYAEIKVRGDGQQNNCGTLEATVLPPIDFDEREKFLGENVDSLNTCGPNPQIQFQLTKPTSGRWSLGVRSRRSPQSSVKLAAQFQYYRGTLLSKDPIVRDEKKYFQWILSPKASPLAAEEVGALWQMTGWEGNRLLKSSATSNFTCISPSSETQSLKFEADRSAESEAATFNLVLAECPAGITDPTDPACTPLETTLSVGGHGSVSTPVSWGQNYCIRLQSAKPVEVKLKVQSKINAIASPCTLSSMPLAPESPEGELPRIQIECAGLNPDPNAGSEIGSTELGHFEVFLKSGHRIIYTQDQKILP